jgi:ribosomal peptide maturation radical SAM protein 1
VTARDRAGLTALHPLVIALESSRGCWWGAKSHCTFCGLNANGMAHRAKTPDRFFAEVEAIRDRYDARHFFMADNILDMRYFDALVKRSEHADDRLQFFYEIKSNAKRSHVEHLAKAGVSAVQPGIEHFSSDVLRLMRKGVTGAQNVAFLKYAHDEGVLPVYNILVNFPGESPQSQAPVVAQLERLSHLRPPSSTPEVEFHRFSPYHRSPQEYNLQLEPLPQYSSLYPFSTSEVARLAYRFQDKGRRGLDSFADLTTAVGEWHRSYADGATLEWWREDDQVIIADSRPGFGPRVIRLAGWAVTVFELLDEPRSLPGVADRSQAMASAPMTDEEIYGLQVAYPNDQVIAFDRGAFLDDPASAMELFDLAGLVFVDPQAGREPLYVTLPVRRSHPPMSSTWLRTGV